MPFCPRCRSEFRPGFSRCDECDADLVDQLPEDPPPDPGNWAEVFRGSGPRADALRGALESAGIETITPDDYSENLGWYAPSAIGMARVLVRENDLPLAREIVSGGHRIDEEQPQEAAADAPAAAPDLRLLALSTLVGRSFLDCFLMLILPCVVASQGGRLSGSGEFLGWLLLEPSLLAVAMWRRRRMIQRSEAVAALAGGDRAVDLVVGVLIGAVLSGIALVYGHLVDPRERHQDPLWASLDAFIVLKFLLAFIAAPICEEAFFRGSILGSFAASGRGGWGVLVSSALFAVGHLNPAMAPLFFVDGIILSAVFLKSRSLFGPVIAHAVSNAVILIVGLC